MLQQYTLYKIVVHLIIIILQRLGASRMPGTIVVSLYSLLGQLSCSFYLLKLDFLMLLEILKTIRKPFPSDIAI